MNWVRHGGSTTFETKSSYCRVARLGFKRRAAALLKSNLIRAIEFGTAIERRLKRALVYTLNSFGIDGLISKRKAAVARWWNVLLRLFSQYPNSAFHLIMSQTAVIKRINLKIVLKKILKLRFKKRILKTPIFWKHDLKNWGKNLYWNKAVRGRYSNAGIADTVYSSSISDTFKLSLHFLEKELNSFF